MRRDIDKYGFSTMSVQAETKRRIGRKTVAAVRTLVEPDGKLPRNKSRYC